MPSGAGRPSELANKEDASSPFFRTPVLCPSCSTGVSGNAVPKNRSKQFSVSNNVGLPYAMAIGRSVGYLDEPPKLTKKVFWLKQNELWSEERQTALCARMRVQTLNSNLVRASTLPKRAVFLNHSNSRGSKGDLDNAAATIGPVQRVLFEVAALLCEMSLEICLILKVFLENEIKMYSKHVARIVLVQTNQSSSTAFELKSIWVWVKVWQVAKSRNQSPKCWKIARCAFRFEKLRKRSNRAKVWLYKNQNHCEIQHHQRRFERRTIKNKPPTYAFEHCAKEPKI